MMCTQRNHGEHCSTGFTDKANTVIIAYMKEETKYGEKAINESALIAWQNPSQKRDYVIEICYPEFTCLCPRSGYPDFATIKLTYTPDKSVLELKSFKLYLNSYRDKKISHEEVTNLIFEEIKETIEPKKLEITGDFNVRGNVKTIIRVTL